MQSISRQVCDEQQRSSFERDGYWLVENLLTAKECDALKSEAMRVLAEHAPPNVSVYVGAAAASRAFLGLADDPRIVTRLGAIMPDGIMFLSDKIVFKSKEQRFATPWHYDALYWPGTRPKISVWIPLDDATASNGTLMVVRGSHLGTYVHTCARRSETNHEFGNFIAERQWNPRDEVVCTLARGGAVFFSDRLVHASCPNGSGLQRTTIIGTYHAPGPDDPHDLPLVARHVIVAAGHQLVVRSLGLDAPKSA